MALEIRSRAIAWAVAESDVGEIDTINIFQATLLAMRRAIERLSTAPEVVWIDGLHCPHSIYPMRAIVDGEDRVDHHALAADRHEDLRWLDRKALAGRRVLGDRRTQVVCRMHALLVELDRSYPLYGFARHKGYSTPEHLAALATHGPCAAHRRTFGPVMQIRFIF